jgi:hypothetical protein
LRDAPGNGAIAEIARIIHDVEMKDGFAYPLAKEVPR